MAERFDEIATKGSTRLQQTVAASLAPVLRREANQLQGARSGGRAEHRPCHYEEGRRALQRLLAKA
jgi:hypothetical protein